MRRPQSLQGRLLAMVLGLVAAVWLVAAAFTWIDVRHELDELLDGHLAQAATLLVVQQSREIGDDDHRMDAPSLHRYAPKVAFQVFHDGRLALRSANAPATAMLAGQEQFQTGFKTVQIGGIAWRVFATHGGERDVQVYVGEQLESRDDILWAALRGMFWPMLVALPMLGLAVWWAVSSGVAPLRSLGRILAARQPDALQAVEMAGATSEMQPMLDALNGLFARITGLMESERRFTADAAHELRTPIAAIRAQAQVALGEDNDDARRHALEATLEGCDRAARLVEQLLTLSRLEADATPSEAPVDLGALVRRVVAELAPQAIRKRQTLAVDAPTTCLVDGNETLLVVLVRNLVDNAIRYSPTDATVNVAVIQTNGRVHLIVEDSGAGLNEDDIGRLGERFFRVIGSGQGGSGLGWSIVRRIAAVHSATIQVTRSSNLGGLAVGINWPLRSA